MITLLLVIAILSYMGFEAGFSGAAGKGYCGTEHTRMAFWFGLLTVVACAGYAVIGSATPLALSACWLFSLVAGVVHGKRVLSRSNS